MRQPQPPSRVRLVRPSLFDQADTGQLTDAAFRLYLGLGTCADDKGWLLWRAEQLAARLLPYRPVTTRPTLLAKHATSLLAVRLLAVLPCGCGFLPQFKRDLAIGGGKPSQAVAAFHASHMGPEDPEHYVALRGATWSYMQSRSIEEGAGRTPPTESETARASGTPAALPEGAPVAARLGMTRITAADIEAGMALLPTTRERP